MWYFSGAPQYGRSTCPRTRIMLQPFSAGLGFEKPQLRWDLSAIPWDLETRVDHMPVFLTCICIYIYMYKWGLIDLNSKPSPIYWRLIIFSWPDDTKVSVVKLNLHLSPSDYVVSQDKPEMTSSHFPAPFTKQSPGAPDFKHPTSASLNCISCSSGTERWTEWNC